MLLLHTYTMSFNVLNGSNSDRWATKMCLSRSFICVLFLLQYSIWDTHSQAHRQCQFVVSCCLCTGKILYFYSERLACFITEKMNSFFIHSIEVRCTVPLVSTNLFFSASLHPNSSHVKTRWILFSAPGMFWKNLIFYSSRIPKLKRFCQANNHFKIQLVKTQVMHTFGPLTPWSRWSNLVKPWKPD